VTDVRGSRVVLIGSIVAVVGLGLFLFEALRAVTGAHILNSTDELLMWVGFGVTAIGGLLLIIGAWSESPMESAPSE
jgi:hypothetical protein